ncbi:MAG: GNAT family N-acetyltransferase [Actinomycetota bacterium]|nr:GNAT family N-acetyltransferase [Actinomycetota bacterium]
MSEIIQPDAGCPDSTGICLAQPSLYKSFWPEVKNNSYFRNRLDYLDFLRNQGGRLFYISGTLHTIPPFILMGKWRDREEIAAIWHLKAREDDKRALVFGSTEECLRHGVERIMTRLLDQAEANEFESWGFEVAYEIVLMEKPPLDVSQALHYKGGVDIVNYKRKYLEEILRVDAAAFDEFWSLDARSMGHIASSCVTNAFILAREGREVLGYAIGGVNGRLGYLQRLGVNPVHQGNGLGQLLAGNLMRSMYRMGAIRILVNTQEDNRAALNLYRKLGFIRTPGRRYIMHYKAEARTKGGR